MKKQKTVCTGFQNVSHALLFEMNRCYIQSFLTEINDNDIINLGTILCILNTID